MFAGWRDFTSYDILSRCSKDNLLIWHFKSEDCLFDYAHQLFLWLAWYAAIAVLYRIESEVS